MLLAISFTLVIGLLAFGIGDAERRNRADLVILALGPTNDSVRSPSFLGGPALIPAAQQAVDDISNRSDILQGYTLKLLEGESGCEFVDKTLIDFTHLAFYHNQSSQIVGIVGPRCTTSAVAICDLIGHVELNIMQVTIASSPAISGTTCINSFRTVGSSLVYVNAYSKLMEMANWTSVGAIYDSSRSFFADTFSAFREKVGDLLNFTYAFFDFELDALATNIKRDCARVLFVIARQGDSRKILCLAFKNNFVYPNVQFLFMEMVKEDFTNKPVHLNNTNQTCSTLEMEHALDGVILIKDLPSREDVNSNLTKAGISYHQFNTTYQSYFNSYIEQRGIDRYQIPISAFRYIGGYYDAVWALALALNTTATGLDLSLTKPRDFGDIMRENMKSLQFEGMSGTIDFDEQRRDVPTIGARLSQCIGSDCVSGSFNNGTLIFKPTTIPDSFVEEFYKIPLPLGISVIVVATVLAILLILLQVAFCKYAHIKEVKATSPHLSHLIFSGCYLFIVSLLALALRETFSWTISLSKQRVIYGVLCSAIHWAFSLGFTLIFGTVASTTWRIYRIFRHFKQGHVRFVADELLLLFVVFLLLIDCVLLIVWNTIDPWQLSARTIAKENSVHRQQLLCTCNHFAEWLTGLFLYKGLLVALLVILSIFVRRVKRKSFKSTKRVIMLIYILVINFFIGFTLYGVFLVSIPILSFVSLSLCLVVAVAIISFSLFLSPAILEKFLPESVKTTSCEQPKVIHRSSNYYNDYYKQKVTSPTINLTMYK